MSESIYGYTHELALRTGDKFTHRVTVQRSVILQHIAATKDMDLKEIDNIYIEKLEEDESLSYKQFDLVAAILLGCLLESDREREKERSVITNNIQQGVPFRIEGEEGDWGIGTTKHDAMMAFIGEEENADWND